MTFPVLQYKVPDIYDCLRLIRETRFELPESLAQPVVWLSLLIILVSILASTAIVISLFAYRFRSQYLNRKRTELEKSYLLLLTGIIFEEEDEKHVQKKKKLIRHFQDEYLHDYFNRLVLRKQLFTLFKNFSGSAHAILRDLYFELQLEKDVLKNLNSFFYKRRIQAIRELSLMQIKEATPRIRKLTSHKNSLIRNEAQRAMLDLDKENPFDFLTGNTQYLSDWDQINLEITSLKTEELNIPYFDTWFNEKNPSIVQFCIKMCVRYNQFDAHPGLIRLLHSDNPKVTLEAAKACGELMIHESADILIQLYPKTNSDIQKVILYSLSKIGGANAVVFLESLYINAPGNEESFAAAKALKSTGLYGETLLEKALKESDTRTFQIAQHLLEERL